METFLRKSLFLALFCSLVLSEGIRVELQRKKMTKTLRAGTSVELTNIEGMTYVGPIFVGSNQDKGIVTYDTGSTTCTIATAECESCLIPVYDPESSETSSLFEEGEAEIKYGSVSLKGSYY